MVKEVRISTLQILNLASFEKGKNRGLKHGLANAAALIYSSTQISTEKLAQEAAKKVFSIRKKNLLTFSPLFTTNHCDSECLMCGMKKSNATMHRKFSGRNAILKQLRILKMHEKTQGVGFVTGEYESSFSRNANAFWIGWAIREALDLGFTLIYCNIGSLDTHEITILTEWFKPSENVNLSVFQETYDPIVYEKFMGKNAPKSDFNKRLNTFNSWIDAGYKNVNPGILVGLTDIQEDLSHLMNHVEHLKNRGAKISISIPRLRPALNSTNRSQVPDNDYLRLAATIAFLVPDCPLVITTRESREMQRMLLPLAGIISPGSPDVAPYSNKTSPSNQIQSSQFLVSDLARPSEILSWVKKQGYKFKNYENKRKV